MMFDEKKERKKLSRIIEKLPDDKRQIAEGLIDNASFMISELSKLQDLIKKNGTVETYQHGRNQSGRKESAEMSVYLKMQKNYMQTINSLVKMLPKSQEHERDALDDWLAQYQ